MEKKKDYSRTRKEIIIAFAVFLLVILLFGNSLYDLFWNTIKAAVGY